VPTSGTDLRIEYRKLRADSGPDGTAADAVDEWLELRLRQELRAVPVPGDWRVLLALRFGSTGDERLAAWKLAGGDSTTLEALNRRMSAGVSVMF
jgi:hypothetical protein